MKVLLQGRHEMRMGWLLMAVIAMLSFAAMSNAAYAIGITPGRTTIDFEPGLERSIEFEVLNNEHKDMDVVLYVKEGAFSELITLYDSIISFTSEEDSKKFRYTLKLPENIDKPGTHEIDIVARELPNTGGGSGASVGATTAVVTQCLVRVPYPGKYAQMDMEVPPNNEGEPVKFFVKARNLGIEDIEKAQATLEVYGPTNELIARLETREEPIKARNWVEFNMEWKANVNPGIYHAIVTLRYDEDNGGGVTVLEKNFAVSSLFIDVREINVKNFRLGGVAKFNIIIESRWNQKIDDVYGDLTISDDQKNKIADVRTASISVDPLGREELNAYWETEDVKVGDYTGMFVLHYAGRTTEKDINTHIGVEDIKVDILDLGVGAIISEPSDVVSLGTDTLIIVLLVVLVGINMGWFLYFRRKR